MTLGHWLQPCPHLNITSCVCLRGFWRLGGHGWRGAQRGVHSQQCGVLGLPCPAPVATSPGGWEGPGEVGNHHGPWQGGPLRPGQGVWRTTGAKVQGLLRPPGAPTHWQSPQDDPPGRAAGLWLALGCRRQTCWLQAPCLRPCLSATDTGRLFPCEQEHGLSVGTWAGPPGGREAAPHRPVLVPTSSSLLAGTTSPGLSTVWPGPGGVGVGGRKGRRGAASTPRLSGAGAAPLGASLFVWQDPTLLTHNSRQAAKILGCTQFSLPRSPWVAKQNIVSPL